MDLMVKTFKELSTAEVYKILQLRSEVFVVEQDCVYQDIDGKDQKALHVLGMDGKILVASTRIFKAGDYAENASIGRVVVKDNFRKYGYGKEIMQKSIEVVKEYFKENKMEVSAQTYLMRFYRELGFEEVGETYLEDGIPHIRMIFNG